MGTGDRPLVQRIARAVQELLRGAATADDISVRHRLSGLLLNDATHAFGSHARQAGHTLTRDAAADDEFVLGWARNYVLEWSNVRRPRHTGRVILLYHKDVEFPSDLHGVIYVDVTGGITPAWTQIETELKGVYGPEINR